MNYTATVICFQEMDSFTQVLLLDEFTPAKQKSVTDKSACLPSANLLKWQWMNGSNIERGSYRVVN